MKEDFDLEKTFKMVAIEKPKEVDVWKEIKLFENVFSNETSASSSTPDSQKEHKVTYISNYFHNISHPIISIISLKDPKKLGRNQRARPLKDGQ